MWFLLMRIVRRGPPGRFAPTGEFWGVVFFHQGVTDPQLSEILRALAVEDTLETGGLDAEYFAQPIAGILEGGDRRSEPGTRARWDLIWESINPLHHPLEHPQRFDPVSTLAWRVRAMLIWPEQVLFSPHQPNRAAMLARAMGTMQVATQGGAQTWRARPIHTGAPA